MNFRELITKNRKVYVAARTAHDFSTNTLYRLLAGYYERNAGDSAFLVEHPGDRCPGKILFCNSIYANSYGEPLPSPAGFFASVREELNFLSYAEQFGFVPVIFWGKGLVYYDPEMEPLTENAFEYYYEPVSGIPYAELKTYKNVAFCHTGKVADAFKTSGYQMGKASLELLASLYKKYFHLNQTTRAYMEKEIGAVLNGKRTLGVQVRGTDFKLQANKHPVFVTPEEYLAEAKKLLASGRYEQVFLATDDLEALELFRREIPEDQLVYFSDVLRSTGKVNPFDVESSRPLHRYKLGLEVLRDVYALACCDGLIGGLSQVVFAAQYINIALDKAYKDCVIVNKGIQAEDTREAKKWKKSYKKKFDKARRTAAYEHGKNP